jgi:tRNA-uridine 2-sulfurtransferase
MGCKQWSHQPPYEYPPISNLNLETPHPVFPAVCYNRVMPERVFVAMSGGVDSSVSAYLLKQAGFSVTGIHLELSGDAAADSEKEHADLEQTCRLLDIPLVYLHLENEFRSSVIDYFYREYSQGYTPNPCVRCNRQIKFGLLLDKVLEMGGRYLATGHYARISFEENEYRLRKGSDPLKDQSYFLHVLGQRELKSILFPIGEMRKTEVKKVAAGLGLAAAVRRESQDICFIPGGDSRAYIAARLPALPGDIVDSSGLTVGRHRGLAFYTVGQRQGMGVSARERLYVIKLEPAANRLVIGPAELLLKPALTAHSLHWISGCPPPENAGLKARIRYHSTESEASLHIENETARVTFTQPQRAVAPGQSVVFYHEDIVLGGGIIAETA